MAASRVALLGCGLMGQPMGFGLATLCGISYRFQ